MIRLKRAEANEVLEKWDLAMADYEKAEVLLPMANWKATAREAIERVRSKIGRTGSPTSQGSAVITTPVVLQVIGGLETILDRAEGQPARGEKLNDRIKRLEDSRLVPRDVANHMHYLKNVRNDVVHGKKGENLTGPGADAFISAWSAVKYWAKQSGYTIDDLP